MLNEPGAAESIYLDILAVEPDNQEALIDIVLAMSDRFGKGLCGRRQSRLTIILTAYHGRIRAKYYTGIVYERRAKAIWQKSGVNAL